jgi:hypothetical protein
LIYKDKKEHQNNDDMEIIEEDENEKVFKNEAKLVQKLTKTNSLLRRLKVIKTLFEMN